MWQDKVKEIIDILKRFEEELMSSKFETLLKDFKLDVR